MPRPRGRRRGAITAGLAYGLRNEGMPRTQHAVIEGRMADLLRRHPALDDRAVYDCLETAVFQAHVRQHLNASFDADRLNAQRTVRQAIKTLRRLADSLLGASEGEWYWSLSDLGRTARALALAADQDPMIGLDVPQRPRHRPSLTSTREKLRALGVPRTDAAALLRAVGLLRYRGAE